MKNSYNNDEYWLSYQANSRAIINTHNSYNIDEYWLNYQANSRAMINVHLNQ